MQMKTENKISSPSSSFPQSQPFRQIPRNTNRQTSRQDQRQEQPNSPPGRSHLSIDDMREMGRLQLRIPIDDEFNITDERLHELSQLGKDACQSESNTRWVNASTSRRNPKPAYCQRRNKTEQATPDQIRDLILSGRPPEFIQEKFSEPRTFTESTHVKYTPRIQEELTSEEFMNKYFPSEQQQLTQQFSRQPRQQQQRQGSGPTEPTEPTGISGGPFASSSNLSNSLNQSFYQQQQQQQPPPLSPGTSASSFQPRRSGISTNNYGNQPRQPKQSKQPNQEIQQFGQTPISNFLSPQGQAEFSQQYLSQQPVKRENLTNYPSVKR